MISEKPIFFKQRVSSLYQENMNTALRLKSHFTANVDPILQRSEKYEVIEPPKRTYTQNYFQKMKQIDEKPTKKITTNQKSNVFTESNADNQGRSKKIFTQRLTARCAEQKIPSVKVFPTKLLQNAVGNLIKQSNTFDARYSDAQPMKKRNPSQGKPSDELKKINDKKQLLPFEIEELSEKRYRRNKSSHRNLKTSERVFTEYVLTHKEGSFDITSPNRRMEVKNNRNLGDNLSDLISYKYGPNFKQENLTQKINNNLTKNYRPLCKRRKD